MFNFIKKLFGKSNNRKSKVNAKGKIEKNGTYPKKSKEKLNSQKTAVSIESATAEKREMSVKYEETVKQIKSEISKAEAEKKAETTAPTPEDTKDNSENTVVSEENPKDVSLSGEFCVNTTEDKNFFFDFRLSNGDTLATSQTYKSKRSCTNGIESVKNNGIIAEIEDTTSEGFEKRKNPKFEIYSEDDKFKFKLKATNGNVIVVSKKFSDKTICMKSVEELKKLVANSEITY